MATEAQYAYFRKKVGDNDESSEVFSDAEIDDIYVEAAEEYTTAKLIKYQAVVLGIEELMADAAKLATYRQNNSSENQSDIFKHLEKLLDYWRKKVEREARRGYSGVTMSRFGPHRVNGKRLPK